MAPLPIIPQRKPAQQLADRRARRILLYRLGSEERVDSFRDEISGVGHRPNAASLGRMRSESHLDGQIFGGPAEIVDLFLRKPGHESVTVSWIFPFMEHLPEMGKSLVFTFFVLWENYGSSPSAFRPEGIH